VLGTRLLIAAIVVIDDDRAPIEALECAVGHVNRTGRATACQCGRSIGKTRDGGACVFMAAHPDSAAPARADRTGGP